jgi:hypothetical protein
MSSITTSPSDDDDDPLAKLREHEDAVEEIAERDDRMGALARYLLAVADGRRPASEDARLARLPDLREGDR